MRRGKNHDDGRIKVLDLAPALNPGFSRHFHIKKHDIGALFLNQAEQLQAVYGFTDQFEALGLLNDFALNQPHACIIIGDDDRDGIHMHSSSLGYNSSYGFEKVHPNPAANRQTQILPQ